MLVLAITAQAEGKDAMEDEPAEAAKIEEGAEVGRGGASGGGGGASGGGGGASGGGGGASGGGGEQARRGGGEELSWISPNDHAWRR